MYKAERRQQSFFDEVYEKAVPEGHFLRELDGLIKWSKLAYYFRRHYKKRGRDAHHPVMMLKLLVLQFLYDLSDRQLEEAARDRISFRWFCRIDPLGSPPDYTAFCRFRDRVGPDTIKKIFDDLVLVASHSGLLVDKLSLVDATEIKAKVDVCKLDKPKDKKSDKNDEESSGSGSHPGSRGGPDPDARWGKKSDKKFFYGYKAHAAVDDGSELITKIDVSPGNVHDGEFFPNVHDPYPEGVTADKAYDSAANFDLIRSSEQRPALIVKKLKGQERGHVCARYDAAERSYYYRKKKRRPGVERKFADGKRYHGMGVARYWGLTKVKLQVYLTAVVLNLKRMVTLTCAQARWQMI
jgi:IS5 family transposase